MKLSKVTVRLCGEKNSEALWKPLGVVPELDSVPWPGPISLGCWGSYRKGPTSCWSAQHALEEHHPMELWDGAGDAQQLPCPVW